MLRITKARDVYSALLCRFLKDIRQNLAEVKRSLVLGTGKPGECFEIAV